VRCRLCADSARSNLSDDVDLCGRCARLVAHEILVSTHSFATAPPEDPRVLVELATAYAEKHLDEDAREAAARAILGTTDDAIVIAALAAIAHATQGRALEALLRRAQTKARRPPS
jgi:hypothetical protein